MRSRDHFSSTLNEGNATKRHGPGSLKAKLTIRENVLAAVGAENARVFDAFSGAGEMYDGVWSRGVSYLGCDLIWYHDDRTCFVADNRRVMRAIDLSPFNIYDFDHFGSPYEQLIILSARRQIAPGERVGLAITDGSALRLKMGWIPDSLALLSGLRRHQPGVARNHEDIINRAINALCRRMNCRVLNQWRAKGRSASALWYIGLVLEGLDAR